MLACRQLIEHRPSSGPLVWLAARMLPGADAGTEAWDAAEMIERDKTDRELEHALPGGTGVIVIGAPDAASKALTARGDIEVFVADTTGEGYGLVHRLDLDDRLTVDVPLRGLGSAVVDGDLVLLETDALGPEAGIAPLARLLLRRSPNRSAPRCGLSPASAAACRRVCGPRAAWSSVMSLEDDHEIVPLDLIDRVVGPSGPIPVAEARFRIDCPVAPELFR